MKTNIKIDLLNDALVELNQFDTPYQIELGFVFGERCYWVSSSNVDQLKSIFCYNV